MHRGNQSLSQSIADRLQNMILNENQYEPNEKIPNERMLAEMLGVSRASIREAIKILVGNGVLTVRRGAGTFVASSPDIMSDPLRLATIEDQRNLQVKWYQVRLMIEPEAMKFVIQNITDEELETLKRLERECADKIENDENCAEEDTAFHIFLAKATHNEILERLMAGVSESVSSGIAVGKGYARENALKNHRLIVQYIENRDEIGAYNAMRLHLLKGLEHITNIDKTNNER